MPHCPVTVVQRYRDWVCMQPLVPLVFHNLPSLYPLQLEEMIFYTCIYYSWQLSVFLPYTSWIAPARANTVCRHTVMFYVILNARKSNFAKRAVHACAHIPRRCCSLAIMHAFTSNFIYANTIPILSII